MKKYIVTSKHILFKNLTFVEHDDAIWAYSKEYNNYFYASACQLQDWLKKGWIEEIKMKCEDCKYWTKQKDTDRYKDIGKCEKLSAPKGEDYPDLENTGIESTPICFHDGAYSKYETKNWFSCMHFNNDC